MAKDIDIDIDINLDLVITESINIIARFVVPLYIENKDKPALIGSGFFVDVNGQIILVSAAHVLNQASPKNPLFAYRRSDEPIKILGKRFLLDPNSIDIGFIKVNEIGLPWTEVKKIACELEYLHPRRVPREERRYVIAGYPETQNRANPVKKTIEAVMYAYHAHSIPDLKYDEIGLDPDTHVALPLDRKKSFYPNGEHMNFPKPQGMSGSPIWELFDESEDPSQTRTVSLVAVATTYKNKIVFGTDIGQLLPRLLDLA